MTSPDADREQIRQLLHTINNAWLHADADTGQLHQALTSCFHEDVVFSTTGLERVAQGRTACINSYADFVSQAQLEASTFDEPTIDVWGETAVASYAWQLTYRMGGQTFHDLGHDVFVFTRTEGCWRATWRMLLPS